MQKRTQSFPRSFILVLYFWESKITWNTEVVNTHSLLTNSYWETWIVLYQFHINVNFRRNHSFLTLGCPSRNTLWRTWENFQQMMGLPWRGSFRTTFQNVPAPFSVNVPMMAANMAKEAFNSSGEGKKNDVHWRNPQKCWWGT